jgi:acyl carrier protein
MTDDREKIRKAVLDGLRQIAPEANLDELSPQANIRRSLEIDSFDFLRLLIGLNERLGVDIPEKDYGNLDTLQRLGDYLAQRLGEATET